jgi:adenine-specific DNA-methyltransferase
MNVDRLELAAESELVRLAVALGAADVGGPLSAAEDALVAGVASEQPRPTRSVAVARRAIEAGEDPLGEAFYRLRPPAVRRSSGAVYTPPLLVQPMVDWVMRQGPGRVVDTGAGSGRFTTAIAARCPDVDVVAVDSDPLATLMTRAAAAVLGCRRVGVVHADYTKLRLPPIAESTAFVGNPPYVRHHNLSRQLKAWAQATAPRVGKTISGLAGLHAYFFLATALTGRQGDFGCFVTSAEWLDVNYGEVIRTLLLDNLGGLSLHVIEPTALPFDGAATTGAITCFRIGDKPSSMRLRSVKAVEDIGTLDDGEPVSRARLQEARRWSPLVRTRQKVPSGYVELGELCRVHRGAVTGLNAVWIVSANKDHLPAAVLFRSVTRARELFEANGILSSAERLRHVIDLPADLDLLTPEDKRVVERFLRQAKEAGASEGYIARNRRAWWSVGLRSPAPILATYMARRPPAFVRNMIDARHVNIAHGLYPRRELSGAALDRLAAELSSSINMGHGRTYAGGLMKFEPREMERLPVPERVGEGLSWRS